MGKHGVNYDKKYCEVCSKYFKDGIFETTVWYRGKRLVVCYECKRAIEIKKD
jgi:hypothetical protein